MKILAFGASNSRESINKILAEYTAKQFENAEVELLDLNDYEMPIFSVDREKHDGIPTLALRFAEKIDASDLLIISFAEHNSTYTTAFKNIFDWISRIKDRKHFGEKPVFVLATAPVEAGKMLLLISRLEHLLVEQISFNHFVYRNSKKLLISKKGL